MATIVMPLAGFLAAGFQQVRPAFTKHQYGVFGVGCPAFVVGQRLGGNDGNAVVGGGDGGEVYADIVIDQMGNRKRGLADDVVQMGGAVGKQHLPIRCCCGAASQTEASSLSAVWWGHLWCG